MTRTSGKSLRARFTPAGLELRFICPIADGLVRKIHVMQLSHDAVDVWIVDLLASSEAVERDYALLSDDERGRADRFRFPCDRRRFVIARAALRRILAAYMETDAQHIAFEYSSYSKPKLAASENDIRENDIRFNTSHSHEKALVACSRGREVG